MSKLSRREFKELLAEWKQNFISERVSLSLRSHIEVKRDLVIIQTLEEKPHFKNILSEHDINYINIGNIVALCNKENTDIKSFINNNFNLDKENKILLESYYNKSYPILVSSGTFSGQFSEENMHTKEDCLNWLIHDLYHSIFDHGNRGQSEFLDVVNTERAKEIISNYKNIFPNLNYDFENFDMHNLMDYDEEYTSDILSTGQYKPNIISEFVTYFRSINFTLGIESFDLMPSIFSYCLIKMPAPEDNQGLDKFLKTTNLSDEAKIYLLIFNSISEQNFNELIVNKFKNKVLFMDFLS
mgnify:CR=1 FL=1|tara:strand:- start:7503 stop:8399 length:897 start_codon:yes stop_codon:yes gene_type:complete